MDKKLLIGIVIIGVLIIAIGAFYFYKQYTPSQTFTDTSQPTPLPDASQPSPDASQTNNIEIANSAFSPAELTIKVGDTITWTNRDSASHTVTSDSGTEISSDSLSNGQTYSYTFNTAGTFEYHCTIHPSMKAKIIVQ